MKMHQRFLEKEMESQLLRKLHGILKPFLLRRLKTDVEYKLPHKKEIAVFTKVHHTSNQTSKIYLMFSNQFFPHLNMGM